MCWQWHQQLLVKLAEETSRIPLLMLFQPSKELAEKVLDPVQVGAIDTCAREPVGRTQCSKIQGEFGEEPSSGALGKAFFGS